MPSLLSTSLAVALVALGQLDAPESRPSRPVPALSGPVWAGLKLEPEKGAGAWSARVGYRKDSLHLGVQTKGEPAEVSIHFPGAGTTAGGKTWSWKSQGARLEVSIPARELPRFPARAPMVFELCIEVAQASNCTHGTMVGPALRLPDAFRRAIGLSPPESVVGLEHGDGGWVGYAALHYPAWVQADGTLTSSTLRRLVSGREIDPKSVGINLPDVLVLPSGQKLLTVVSGKNPFDANGQCDPNLELRLGLYLVKGRAAERVLDWPASACSLGRAAAVDLDEQGELTLGYTDGSTVTFVWSKDHFERTEIGSR
jgi:hypothetical protein